MNTHGSFGIFNPFLYSIGSAGSELAFEVILSDNCTKRTAIAKQGSPAFLPPVSVSLTTTAQLQGGASGSRVWEALHFGFTQGCCIVNCCHLICDFHICRAS